jgi:hypothetical protein
MPRTSLRQDTDYYIYRADIVDIDDADDLEWKDGVSTKAGWVNQYDTMCDHWLDYELNINFGVAKRQYEAYDEAGLVSKHEEYVNKGVRQGNRFKDFMQQFDITSEDEDG